jgi:hypothetical protein
VLKAVHAVVEEWARRHVVPDAATTTFINEVRAVLHMDAVRVQSSK